MSYLIAMFAAIFAPAQTAVLKGEKAIACQGSTTTCPNGHKTCRNIDMPVVIGNDNRSYPDWSQLMEYRFLACSVCSVAFVEKQ